MPDREKVISEFEDFVKSFSKRDDTYYKGLFVSVLALLKEQEAVKPQDAEMLVIYNGGAEEYVKDIESIVLLAHKDYDIVYCGKFSEGR